MDQHPTPFPGKTRRSVATAGKAKPEQGKGGGGREPSVVAARYNQPQRRVFGTLRTTNAKVEDINSLQKAQHLLAKSGTKPRKPAFVAPPPSACLKKQGNDHSPKNSRQPAGSADAKKKKSVGVSFREPLPEKGAGGNDGCSPKDSSKEQAAAKKPVAVSFLEPLPGKCPRGDSPTESKKQAGSWEGRKHAVTKDPGSLGNQRSITVVKQAGSSSGSDGVKKAATRDAQPPGEGKRRSVGSASRNARAGADEEPRTPAPLLAAAAAATAAAHAAATPYLSARDCSKCRLDRLETASYWIAQIKLAESSGKHYVAAAFFRLAYQCNAEPFRRLKSELSSYVERHLTVSNAWPDVCRLYGLLEEEEPAATLESGLAAGEEHGKTPAKCEATSEDHGAVVDVAALLALEGEVMEKSAVLSNHETGAECGVACEDCCDRCLVPGATAVEALLGLEDDDAEVPGALSSKSPGGADGSHVQDRDVFKGNSPLGYSAKAKNPCGTTTSSLDNLQLVLMGAIGPCEGDFRKEESFRSSCVEPSPRTSGAGVSPSNETTDECQGDSGQTPEADAVTAGDATVFEE